jgi:hypothetical protein
MLDTRDDPEERGLARAIDADQRDMLPLDKLERNVPENLRDTEMLRQILDRKDRHTWHRITYPPPPP